MKTKGVITCDDLSTACWTFHKLTRTSDLTKNLNLWNAINELDDHNFYDLMEEAFMAVGIKINNRFKCRQCGKGTRYDNSKKFYPGIPGIESYRLERARLHKRLCRKCNGDAEYKAIFERYERMRKIWEKTEGRKNHG